MLLSPPPFDSFLKFVAGYAPTIGEKKFSERSKGSNVPGGQTEYKANDPEVLVGELFSGKLSIKEALQRLRTRLLDLSPRNRLLNYRHPKGRCIQFVNDTNLNLLFERLLVNSKSVVIKPVPEPDPLSYEGRRSSHGSY